MYVYNAPKILSAIMLIYHARRRMFGSYVRVIMRAEGSEQLSKVFRIFLLSGDGHQVAFFFNSRRFRPFLVNFELSLKGLESHCEC